MKRFVRILIDLVKWLGGLFLLFIVVVNLSIFLYIEFAGNWLFTEDEKVKLIKEINSTEALPPLFYKVNEQYFPECYNQGFWVCKLKQYFLNSNCSSESNYAPRIVFFLIKRNNANVYKRFNWIAIARFIDKNTSLKQCYNYRMRFAEYGENTKNLDEAAQTFFNKTIEELNEKEVLSLHVIYVAPTRFSLRRNPKKLNDKVESLMKVYKK